MVTDGAAGGGGRPGGGNTRVLADRYRLEAQLGRGGMGVVWRATDQLLGRQVAVKEVALDLGDALSADDARVQRERALREARALAQLGHPHIISVHDVVEADDRPYIVMELVDGPSLAERIARTGPVDTREAARIGIALLGALRKAHESGVLHRDLKPANVLLESGTGRVVLTDFGTAHLTGATTLTEAGSFMGSPEYTAPERMSGVRTGPESDLWSLGALLCAAVSGISPFHRDSLGGVLHAVVSDEIRTPAQAGPLLPVIWGLLERDPDRRLDAAEAERMLRGYADTGRVPAPRGASVPGGTGAARTRWAPRVARLPHLPSRGAARLPRVPRLPHRASRRGTPRSPAPAPPDRPSPGRPPSEQPPSEQPPLSPPPADQVPPAQDRRTGAPDPAPSPRGPAAPGAEQPPEAAGRDGGSVGGGGGAAGPGAVRPAGGGAGQGPGAGSAGRTGGERPDHTFAPHDRPPAPADHPVPLPDRTSAPADHTSAPAGRGPAPAGGTPSADGGTSGPTEHPSGEHWPSAETGPWPPAEAEPWSAPAADTGSGRPGGGRTGRRAGPFEPRPPAVPWTRSRTSADTGPRTSPGAVPGSGPVARAWSGRPYAPGSGASAGADGGTSATGAPPWPAGSKRRLRTLLIVIALVAGVAGAGMSAVALLAKGSGTGQHGPVSPAPATPVPGPTSPGPAPSGSAPAPSRSTPPPPPSSRPGATTGSRPASPPFHPPGTAS
ncbi:hypothetical protein GCM10018793_29900 [Streptomyces sulfonofaciens]|uniref:non-specific serine/threonine protein kinase n=1 Tax=Streptomyces sulfonofaciens TaxID=68272 RepID=A0A919G5W4_9ACTN|nr:serine/threonine-protein kinase [Streptomyces sulfonofaciens]GHH78713.1 hypothetical protein GCM10018793_29900 [Streptomyces sulfonofaciens]